jgi:hypothetical protein
MGQLCPNRKNSLNFTPKPLLKRKASNKKRKEVKPFPILPQLPAPLHWYPEPFSGFNIAFRPGCSSRQIAWLLNTVSILMIHST